MFRTLFVGEECQLFFGGKGGHLQQVLRELGLGTLPGKEEGFVNSLVQGIRGKQLFFFFSSFYKRASLQGFLINAFCLLSYTSFNHKCICHLYRCSLQLPTSPGTLQPSCYSATHFRTDAREPVIPLT